MSARNGAEDAVSLIAIRESELSVDEVRTAVEGDAVGGIALFVGTIGVIAALAVAVLVPVPYVILGPGPTLNTLGQDSSGQPLITITGHVTYPTAGHLNMVTVGYRGGPGVNINIFSALAAWLNPHEAVVPESELFTPGSTQQETQQQDTQQMTGSQEAATAAAPTGLHIPSPTHAAVAG